MKRKILIIKVVLFLLLSFIISPNLLSQTKSFSKDLSRREYKRDSLKIALTYRKTYASSDFSKIERRKKSNYEFGSKYVGDCALYLSTSFGQFNARAKSKRVFGISAGIDVYFERDSFFEFSATIMTSTLRSLKADEVSITPILLNASMNHEFGRFSIGWGITGGLVKYKDIITNTFGIAYGLVEA